MTIVGTRAARGDGRRPSRPVFAFVIALLLLAPLASVAAETSVRLDARPATTTPMSPITLTATVTATSGGAAGGTLSFVEGDTTLATAQLTAVGIEGGLSGIQDHVCALTAAGGVRCWGSGRNGELGNGAWADSAVPVDVVDLTTGVVAVATGADHGCALTTAGGVKCWGSNLYGQLGDGTTVSRARPADVVGLTRGVVALSLGDHHGCALLAAGGVSCWGYGGEGRLGNGGTTDALVPVPVTGLGAEVVALALGGAHGCVLTRTGGARCWGDGDQGRLGDGTSTSSATPVDVAAAPSDLLALAAGAAHTCALARSGPLVCWGSNDDGRLGDGTTTARALATEVVGLTTRSVAVAAGGRHTCAIDEAGAARCWGRGTYGELGDGSTTTSSSPVSVVGLETPVTTIALGNRHGCAATTDGAVRCWGAGQRGQLGDGTTALRPLPALVPDLATPSRSRATAILTDLSIGTHDVVAVYPGDEARPGAVSPATRLVVAARPTTTALLAGPGAPVHGQPLALAATVASAGDTATGDVEFRDGTTSLGTIALADAQAAATLALPAGGHRLTAAYGGDATHAASTSAELAVEVAKGGTTTTLAATPGSVAPGGSITLMATLAAVAPAVGTPSAAVVFAEGGTPLATVAATDGVARTTVAATAVGSRVFTATTDGDEHFAGSISAPATVIVTRLGTTTGLTPSADAVTPGAALALTARVTAPAGTPVGDVAFTDGGSAVGTATLAAGVATLTVRPTALGDHGFAARYLGSATHATSTATTTVTVDPRLGPPFRINTTTAGAQKTPALAALAGGGFVAVWASDRQDGSSWGIYGQLFDRTGQRSGGEFRVNTATADAQTAPTVAATADGGFVVAWLSTASTGKSKGVWAQRFSAAGKPVAKEFRIDTTAGPKQSRPTLAAAPAGGFAATWISSKTTGIGFFAQAQIHDANAKRIGSEVKASATVMPALGTPPSIAALSGGGWVVVWPSATTAGADPIVKAQRLTAKAAKVGAEFAVTTGTFAQTSPAATGTADGGFVVAWVSQGQDGSGKGIYAQLHKADGTKIGTAFRVTATTTGDQYEPRLAARPGGGFLVAWTSAGQDGSGTGVYARRFSATGSPLEGEIGLATTIDGDQSEPAIAATSATDFVAAWTSSGEDGDAEGVFGQRFTTAP